MHYDRLLKHFTVLKSQIKKLQCGKYSCYFEMSTKARRDKHIQETHMEFTKVQIYICLCGMRNLFSAILASVVMCSTKLIKIKKASKMFAHF